MNDSSETGLGSRVRLLREEKGWSQSELAGRLPNVRQQSIDQLEQGQVKRPRFLPELALILETSVQWLLTGEGEKRRAAAAPAVLADLDNALLRDVFVAVETTLIQQNLQIDHAHKAQLVGALYELMRGEEKRDAVRLAQVANDIVNYDQLMRKSRPV